MKTPLSHNCAFTQLHCLLAKFPYHVATYPKQNWKGSQLYSLQHLRSLIKITNDIHNSEWMASLKISKGLGYCEASKDSNPPTMLLNLALGSSCAASKLLRVYCVCKFYSWYSGEVPAEFFCCHPFLQPTNILQISLLWLNISNKLHIHFSHSIVCWGVWLKANISWHVINISNLCFLYIPNYSGAVFLQSGFSYTTL